MCHTVRERERERRDLEMILKSEDKYFIPDRNCVRHGAVLATRVPGCGGKRSYNFI